jgi:hypothetical protein
MKDSKFDKYKELFQKYYDLLDEGMLPQSSELSIISKKLDKLWDSFGYRDSEIMRNWCQFALTERYEES